MAAPRRTQICLWPPLPGPVLLAVAVLVGTSAAAASTSSASGLKKGSVYQTADFVIPHSNGSFYHLVVSDKTHDVFVGAVDYLYRLDKDLSEEQEVKTGPELDNGKCPPPVDDVRCSYERQYTNNVNKVLVIDKATDHLIACGTLFHGYCERRDLSNISALEDPEYRMSVVSNNASASTVAFIAQGPSEIYGDPQPGVLYVSVSWSKQEGILEDIPAFASRKLTDFSLAYRDSLKFTSTSFNFENQQRPQFPVRYVYGFDSDNFSYMLTVQKKNSRPEDNTYHSVAIRVCQNDKNYYSYVEVPLNCTHGETEYNILEAAYLAKAGRNLAISLGINTKSNVLYALFSVGEQSSPISTAQTALCVFEVDDIRSKFTENIKKCFSGEGISGGGHLGSAKPCTKNTQFKIDDDYCGETDSNQPLAGTIPIHSEAVLAFPSNTSHVSAISVAITNDYTVAFVGTKDGKVIKVSVESNSSANIYETLSVVSDTPIKRDMHFDDDMEHLYLLTDKKVVKLKVQDCTQYSSCSECLGARDPYCGWCSLENKCSRKRECQGSDMPKRWLSYNSQECPKIERIIPNQIQKDKNKQSLLTLIIKHLPEFQQPNSTYECVFSPVNDSSASSETRVANRTGSSLQCYTPPSEKLPQFKDNEDSVDMRLSVRMNGQELVYEIITFFDCDIHSSCTTCTLSQFPCTWCIKSHRCTDNKDEHCGSDVLITGLNQSGTSRTPGPDHCPRFDDTVSGTEILVAAGSQQSISVRGVALQDFQLAKLKCRFNINTVIEVNATATPRIGGFAGDYDIKCDSVKFNYLTNTSKRPVPFSILWDGTYNALDNPRGIGVLMYKCSSMAPSCGECLIIDPKFKCGWCNDAYCATDTFCQGSSGRFQERSSICNRPVIDSFQPSSGPLQGGTLVTITGQNLGTESKEVRVQIDMVKCIVVNFTAPKRIICKTERTDTQLQDKIKVIVGQKDVNVKAESKNQFSFVIPHITDIAPILGPNAGGTQITVKGEHLDAGSNISVLIGQKYPCTEPKRLNSTAITCKTSAVPQPVTSQLDVSMNIDNASLQAQGVVFKYVENPNVTWVSRKMVIRSGGLLINVSGVNLHHVKSPEILIWHKNVSYAGPCKFTAFPNTNITCLSPYIAGLESSFDGSRQLDFGFRMDNVKHLRVMPALGKMTVYPDPIWEPYKGGEIVHQHGDEILFIKGQNLVPLKTQDVKVHIGEGECSEISVGSSIITCKSPTKEPDATNGGSFPEIIVEVGYNQSYLGVLRYEKPEELTQEAIIGIGAGIVAVVIITVIICIVCLIKFRRNDDMMKKMRKEMDQLESRVANECKEAFAELQTDMSELTSDLSAGSSIPFWDYRTYCMRVLFPPECNDHPVIRELELDYRHREDTERGLKLFFNLIRNKTFLLIFIRTLEANKDFGMKERVNVASLISVSLQTQMEYATEILKTLLAELIEKTVENPKVHPKILLRRNESVAEKMLTNWFTFLLYKFLKECAGEPLFMLYGAIKQQVSKGPVDAVTSEARYSLSEDKLIRQHINYKPMVLYVMDVDVDRCSQPAHPVKVLDCDTISQVKEKILDSLYKSAPFSSRPPKEELDLVLFDHPPEWIVGDKSQVPLKLFPNKDTRRLVLSDDDNTTKMEGDCKRLNTLSHYKVSEGAYVALHPKQTSMYNNSIMSEKSKYSDNSYYNRSPSLNRSLSPQNVHIDVEGCKIYHLVRHQDVESNNKEGDRGSKMVSEIYLPRLLVTKGTLQTFVDDLFERIFSTAHRGTALPLAIKYMFDFLDDQALHHSMGDEVVHIWKSNSLPLRFWVNVIKNPNFAFDIYKSNIVDACLTVIGQTFMDCCSTLEHKLTKDSPSGKLLYAKDIPKYRQWVARYYQDIKIMPAISDQDMTAMLAEESRTHQNEFNTNAALLELYKYVKKHYDDILNALDDDEFAKKSKLTYKLEQVSAAMDGTTVC